MDLGLERILRSFLSCDVFLWFLYQGNTGSSEQRRKYSLLFLKKRLCRIDVNSPVIVRYNLPVEPSGPGLSCVGSALLVNSLSCFTSIQTFYFFLSQFQYFVSF